MMARFVRFTLFGPMASWGDVAVGPMRPTRATPTRSAVLGIVAASLGLDRADDAGQRALTEQWNVAAMTLSTGRLVRDYHTVQSTLESALNQARKAGFWPRTRRRALEAGRRFSDARVPTSLSERDYRSDHLSVICLWPTERSTRWQPSQLVDALRRPVFVPYLGRKSCPLAAPMAPDLIEADSPIAALESWNRGAQFGEVGGPIQRRTSTIAHGLVPFSILGGAGRAPQPSKLGSPTACGLRPSSKTGVAELSRIGRVWVGPEVGNHERAILTWDPDDRFPMKRGASMNHRRDRSRSRARWHFDERLEAMCLAAPREES